MKLKMPSAANLDALWASHHAEWRDPAQITSQWQAAADTDSQLLRYSTQGQWWEVLAASEITLFVTREYEHLVMAMQANALKPVISFMRLPHPSGLVANREQAIVHIASTRNPNQVYDLQPVSGKLSRLDIKDDAVDGIPLIPVRSRFYPGCLYMHDLALIEGDLYANAVGQNAVVRLGNGNRYERIWWPRCIEQNGEPVFGQNHIQLNSIAAGENLSTSYFSASADTLSTRLPGHRNFSVNKRGVLFSGATRDAVARGLTRPHSARWHEGKVWIDNSGYGEFGFADLARGTFEPVTRLPGWTRGLCFYRHIAFVGTSRIIPRFRNYAPGLNVDQSQCGLHAIDTRTGRLLGSLTWPSGNQVFAIDWMPTRLTTGFPFASGGKRATARQKALFYAFQTSSLQENEHEQ